MTQPSAEFEKMTRTFSADRDFFDALMKQPCGEAFAEMCVWYNWHRNYLNDIQESLAEAGIPHGDTYAVWVLTMLVGVAHAVGMLMYLSVRGVVHEAGASGRRALEFLGIASHLLTDPSKARFLFEGCESTKQFREAFLSGSPKEADRAKQLGIKFRFAGMASGMEQAATQLWEMFSRFNVHGDSLAAVSAIPSLLPTEHSCAFLNRSVLATGKEIELFRRVPEISAIELATLVGKFGTKSTRVRQAGACVLVWLNKQDKRWLAEVEAMRDRLGVAQDPGKTN
jgi:hypothetical protein